MIEPLDIGTVNFFLLFNGESEIEIAEPIKFDAANFVIEQKEKGLGRDVSFASGKANLRFSPKVNVKGTTHQFDKIINQYKTNGFESNVKFIIKIEGATYVIGQLDFAEADTDLTTYFECKVIQENKEALIKARSKIKVDLLSSKDLDGNEIGALAPAKMFLRATPFAQKSEWTMPEPQMGIAINGNVYWTDIDFLFSAFPNISINGIEDTLSPPVSDLYGNAKDFMIIRAKDTVTNGKLVISDLSYNFKFFPQNVFSNMLGSLNYYIGTDFHSGDETVIFDTGLLRQNNPEFSIENQTFIVDNLTIERGQYLLLFFRVKGFSNNLSYNFENFVTSGKLTFTAVSTSVSSIIRVFNLGDAMRQVIKSISGMQIDAPRFTDENGEFKQQYITDGLRIRNIIDEPFNISLEDIEKQLPEWRGDYEVGEGNVFFGLFKDFYRDEKIGEFQIYPNSVFKSGFNKEYTTNTFEYKWDKYSNDNEEDGSREAVHCRLQMSLPNKMVENNKSVNIGFIRDSFMLENNRKKAIDTTDNIATANDNDIFIIDGVLKDLQVRETMVLRHLVLENNDLKLLNNGTFNWLFSGISPTTVVTLELRNAERYRVISINETVLTLRSLFTNPTFSGEGITVISYGINQTRLTNRTTEGVNVIAGASNPEGFSNIRFTPKRNIYNYWSNYLLTAAIFHKESSIRMTEFLYNRKLVSYVSDYPDLTIIEGDDISYQQLEGIDTAILLPYICETEVICDFPTFWNLRDAVRKKRGYLEVKSNDGDVFKIYPKLLDLNWEKNLLKIKGERKK